MNKKLLALFAMMLALAAASTVATGKRLSLSIKYAISTCLLCISHKSVLHSSLQPQMRIQPQLR